MQPLEERQIECPYCGEIITLLLDCSVEEQHYIEDCEVCCRPIEVHATIDADNQLWLTASSGDQ